MQEPLKVVLWHTRKNYILQMLRECRGNREEAARLSGIAESTLNRLLGAKNPPKVKIWKRKKPKPCHALVVARLPFPQLKHRCPTFWEIIAAFGVKVSAKERKKIQRDGDSLKLSWIADDCRRRYLRLVRQFHPDTNLCVNGELYKINAQWEMLKRRLRRYSVSV